MSKNNTNEGFDYAILSLLLFMFFLIAYLIMGINKTSFGIGLFILLMTGVSAISIKGLKESLSEIKIDKSLKNNIGLAINIILVTLSTITLIISFISKLL